MTSSFDSMTILLLAPSRVLAATLLHELRAIGVDQIVTTCNTIAQALDCLAQQKIDVVISSMYFEDGDVFKLIEQTKMQDALTDLIFLLVSSEQRNERLEQAREAGVVAVLPRPFARNALENALADAAAV